MAFSGRKSTTRRWPVCRAAALALSAAVWQARPSGAASAESSEIVLGLNGNIVVMDADGTHRNTLTTKGWNSAPHMSPDGRWVAFLGETRTVHDHPTGKAIARTLWIARSDGSGAYGAIRGGQDHALISWSPNSRFLAYSQGTSARVRNIVTNRTQTVLTARDGFTLDSDPALAWSGDSTRLAVPLYRLSFPTCPVKVPVAISDLRTARVTRATVRLPLARYGACGSVKEPGTCSLPAPDLFTWTRDDSHFQIGTIGCGEGRDVTGVWRVAAAGGTATLLIGTPSGLTLKPPQSTMLYGATRFAVSPDMRWLVTDPGYAHPRFWLARPDGTAGRYFNPGLPKFCEIAQFSWLSDSSALAYVDVCPVTGTGPYHYRFALYFLPLSGSGRKLLNIKSKLSDAMEIGPFSRCVACGG